MRLYPRHRGHEKKILHPYCSHKETNTYWDGDSRWNLTPLRYSGGNNFVSIIFAVVLLVGRRYGIFSAIHSVERDTFGEVFLPLGVAFSALLFLPHSMGAFQFGVFVMGISDALAGLAGERFGRHHIKFLSNRKSLEGSLVFFLSSLILTFLFVQGFDYRILVIPLILTGVEFFLEYGLDNLILPIAGAYLIQALL